MLFPPPEKLFPFHGSFLTILSVSAKMLLPWRGFPGSPL